LPIDHPLQPQEVLGRLEAARKGLYVRLQELREDAEWKRWANTDVQEDLCARAEALLGGQLVDAERLWESLASREAQVQAAEATAPEPTSPWRARLPNGVVLEGSADLARVVEALAKL